LSGGSNALEQIFKLSFVILNLKAVVLWAIKVRCNFSNENFFFVGRFYAINRLKTKETGILNEANVA
jgi:hypothetical protein